MKLHYQPWAAAVLLCSGLLPGTALPQSAGAPPSAVEPAAARAAVVKSDPLADGAEVFENLTESAPSIDAAAFDKALAQIDALKPAISQHLTAERKFHFDTLLSAIRGQWQKGDRSGMALQSIEAYRLLEESIDRNGQPIPLEVNLLDYAGFKLNALMSARSPDWQQITQMTQEAAGWWAAIGPRVTDKTLHGAMARTVAALQEAAAKKNADLLRFAADMDLTLVDGLEGFFAAHPRTS